MIEILLKDLLDIALISIGLIFTIHLLIKKK